MDTSFLPDKEREQQDRERRDELRREWVAKQVRASAERRKETDGMLQSLYSMFFACLATHIEQRREMVEARSGLVYVTIIDD